MANSPRLVRPIVFNEEVSKKLTTLEDMMRGAAEVTEKLSDLQTMMQGAAQVAVMISAMQTKLVELETKLNSIDAKVTPKV